MSATATKKSNSDLLKSFIQRNKVSREKKAQKEGFSTAAEYISFLKTGKKATATTTTTPPKSTKTDKSSSKNKITTIHVVDILDRSGSMSGPKIQNAKEFLNKGVEELQNSKDKVVYTHTYCQFDHNVDLQYLSKPVKGVSKIACHAGGTTALYDAIGQTLTAMKSYLKDTSCKVLVNIYTDGEENASRKYNSESVGKLIEEYNSKNFTITFIGTKQDVASIIRKTKVHASNTASYDGTGEGLKKVLGETLRSRTAYFTSAVAGEDVSKGFYKDIK